MARVTVEDCTKNVDSLFDLVLLASHRAKVLNAGNEANIAIDNDKNTVVALREIADEKISVDEVKEDITWGAAWTFCSRTMPRIRSKTSS